MSSDEKISRPLIDLDNAYAVFQVHRREGEGFTCSICKKSYASEMGLKVITDRRDISELLILLAHFTFELPFSFVTPEQKHTENIHYRPRRRAFNCEICGTDSYSKLYLLRHMERAHGIIQSAEEKDKARYDGGIV